MMSSLPRFASRDGSDQEDGDPTPTESPARSVGNGLSSSRRPSLMRAPGRLSELEQNAAEEEDSADATDSSSNSDIAPDEPRQTHPKLGKGRSSPSTKDVLQASHTQEDVAKLREAVMLNQHRTRTSVGSFRVSPIKEEVTSDPSSLDPKAHGESRPARTSSTVSTASNESQRTIRGSSSATPIADTSSLRTPSYPFPYVPGTPRTWQNLHQPFTTLSPTVTNRGGRGVGNSPEVSAADANSIASSPPAFSAFLPSGFAAAQPPEDPRFPTPNFYDMILDLNAEPGMERWWTVVSNLLHDHFGVDRATVVGPMDATDLENVPWGQKATFNICGSDEDQHQISKGQTAPVHPSLFNDPELRSRQHSGDMAASMRSQKLHPERLRPRLESRHSYAGHGREVRDVTGTPIDQHSRPPSRPQGPRRTVTHAPGMEASSRSGRGIPRRVSSTYSVRHTSLSDTEFSSIGAGIDLGPYAEVFPNLVALDHEKEPLIQPIGVSRVLRRGKIVTVIRDYASEGPNASVSQQSANASEPRSSKGSFAGHRGGQDSNSAATASQYYDEYEQQGESPWTQSPGPSPAIQADEERNPFFASDNQLVEDSFEDPVASPDDYSRLAPPAAVGVDHANSVIHIPLVHPTLSQTMAPLGRSSRSNLRKESVPHGDFQKDERKAPIAILSILSPVVPYPPNLLHSLKMLGPHLATSYSTALQLSTSFPQALNIRHRRTASGNRISTAPMTIAPASLEDIMKAELEEPPGSATEPMTSPSDYSGRSRHSPSSILGTPGWDMSFANLTSSRSGAGTPAGPTTHDMVDSYFEAKKRTGHRTSNASSTVQSVPTKSRTSVGSNESKSAKGSTGAETSQNGSRRPKASSQGGSKEDAACNTAVQRDPSPPSRPVDSHLPHRSSMAIALSQPSELKDPRPHSLLHSYGADLHASFGFPNAGTPGEPRTPFEHSRKSSYPEDMPPPSERLLRTIIDSVPVQIFTAQPETGQLTWVNSKFLIYRGQEPRQVLSDPWQAIHPHDRDGFSNLWHRSLRTNQQMQQKVRLQRFDGDYRWFYVRAAPLKDRNLKVVHWIGTMMDFHEQHIAEQNSARQQETAASEAKYRALANSSPQIVFAVNQELGVTFCNSQWLHYSGQTEARALGIGFMDHVHPDDLVKCRLPKFEGDSNQPTNVPVSLPPEPRRSLSGSIDSSGGSPETERPPMGSEASTSPISQMPQRKLSELARTGIQKVSRDADGRPSYSTEVRLKSKDGLYRWHLVRVLRADPILQADKEEGTWYGTCTDINDHKTLERDLKETMDEKSRFLSNMSHEIRTPLNGITGMVNFLIDSSLTAEQMEHVNIIRTSTEGLRGLINDILDLSKAEAGMIQLNMDWMYIRALIEEVNDLTSTMAIDKGLELNYVVEEDVPAQIKGDRFRIRQILLNIVGNAIKFTQKGEVFIRCCLQPDFEEELAQNETFIKFEVVDSGRGFTEAEAEFLFKRFSQIDGSSTRQHGGTGLGLVISRQLAQLHGGDMSARGVPEKGSTFTFYIKTSLPSLHDQPPPPTPGVTTTTIPILPGPLPTPTSVPTIPEGSVKLYSGELTESPAPYAPLTSAVRDSPSSTSPASSGPSIRSGGRNSSVRSERSSASSFVPEMLPPNAPLNLALPTDLKLGRLHTSNPASSSLSPATSMDTLQPREPSSECGSLIPPMFSILVIAPLKHSREATVTHIDKTLPRNVPHQITARESVADCEKLLGGEEPVIFTHVVVVLQDVDEIIALMRQVLSPPSSTTAVVLITDLAQRRKITDQAPDFKYDELISERRLRFIFKPLKPSRLGLIFDPQKEREMSTDRNQDSAQQIAVNQKQVFEEVTRRLGNKDKRVLLVEDNRVNQMVILKFLGKVSIEAETVLDGVQCTEKVFAAPPGYYSIILCDLHMPNKDGYQTCREIRQWEKRYRVPSLPIIALSANVLGDVYQKCVDSGFNSYMTKPVDFKELSSVLMTFMDPSDPSKPHELMKMKRSGR